MAIRYFECDHCDAHGKITIKDESIGVEDIVYCPVCGGDIYEEEDYDQDE